LRNALAEADKHDDSWWRYDIAGWYCCIDAADQGTAAHAATASQSNRKWWTLFINIYPPPSILSPSLYSSLMILVLLFVS
jgi:hypothetical protein